MKSLTITEDKVKHYYFSSVILSSSKIRPCNTIVDMHVIECFIYV